MAASAAAARSTLAGAPLVQPCVAERTDTSAFRCLGGSRSLPYRQVAIVGSSRRTLRVRSSQESNKISTSTGSDCSSWESQENNGASSSGAFSRRASLLLAASAGALLADWSVLPAAQALPFLLPPAGFRLYVDRLDGYSFFYPDSWVEVRGSGQDCFFRSSFNLDENVSVEVSSPSSSRFASVRDLGDADAAGKRVEKQLLTEFMSTRLGVRREASLISSATRVVPAGTGRRGAGEAEQDAEYYDVELNVKSYANNNQLAIMPDERVQVLEWNRRYLTVLAVANKRLFQLRLQVPERLLDAERPVLRQVMDSFRVFSVAE
ncbi:hypothetical protein CLOP_g21910 [Closterium sp. NIES-67]|nr:hypothetical protein CLOP_g21910 [Closterium sp. NIES-67]